MLQAVNRNQDHQEKEVVPRVQVYDVEETKFYKYTSGVHGGANLRNLHGPPVVVVLEGVRGSKLPSPDVYQVHLFGKGCP